MTAITVEHLSKVYYLYDSPTARLKEALHPLRKKYHHDFYALNDVSFSVEQGEVLGIIGKNGCGKSTLLKILAGVLTPTSGTVTVNGNVSALLELGSGFNPEFTGLENVYFSSAIMGYSREQVEKNLDNILAFADIGEFIHQPVKTYSSGMYVRLAFAVAINVEPDVLIVDEALSVGDASFQVKCFNKFQEFIKKGCTILLVSHDINTINSHCNRVLLIEHGNLLMIGEPKPLTNRYHQMLFSSEVPTAIERISQYDSLSDLSVSSPEQCLQDISSIPPQINKILNKGCLKYGNGDADFFDFGIIDKYGRCTTLLEPFAHYIIYCRIRLNNVLENLTVGIRIRNPQGVDVFAANTNYHNITIPSGRAGDVLDATFDVIMNLGPGEYFTTIGVRNLFKEEFACRYVDAFKLSVTAGKTTDPVCVANLQEKVRATLHRKTK